MAAIAEYTLPTDQCPLGDIFEAYPDATIVLDRVVPFEGTVMPYFWVHEDSGEFEKIRELMNAHPEILGARILEALGDKALFCASWDPEHLGIMRAITEAGLTVISSTGTSEGWQFEMRAIDRSQLSEFRDLCNKYGLTVTLHMVRQLSNMPGDECGLTEEQVEALTLAFKHGYFDEPRAVDQNELAEKLGISRQALSSRLRRGYRNLIEQTLMSNAPPEP